MNSDPDFLMFRKFGQLHNRLLLYRQDELTELEERLNKLDEEETTAYFLCSRRHDLSHNRRELMTEIQTSLKQYGRSIPTTCPIYQNQE